MTTLACVSIVPPTPHLFAPHSRLPTAVIHHRTRRTMNSNSVQLLAVSAVFAGFPTPSNAGMLSTSDQYWFDGPGFVRGLPWPGFWNCLKINASGSMQKSRSITWGVGLGFPPLPVGGACRACFCLVARALTPRPLPRVDQCSVMRRHLLKTCSVTPRGCQDRFVCREAGVCARRAIRTCVVPSWPYRHPQWRTICKATGGG